MDDRLLWFLAGSLLGAAVWWAISGHLETRRHQNQTQEAKLALELCRDTLATLRAGLPIVREIRHSMTPEDLGTMLPIKAPVSLERRKPEPTPFRTRPLQRGQQGPGEPLIDGQRTNDMERSSEEDGLTDEPLLEEPSAPRT